jgi:hypothetical protein
MSVPGGPELLMVLDRPEIPLHTNGSENDIGCRVTRRKVSGGTPSDIGRDYRDAFLGIAKTCAKLEIAFWDYLGARLAVPRGPAFHTRLHWFSPAPNHPNHHGFCSSYGIQNGQPRIPVAIGRPISDIRSST